MCAEMSRGEFENASHGSDGSYFILESPSSVAVVVPSGDHRCPGQYH